MGISHSRCIIRKIAINENEEKWLITTSNGARDGAQLLQNDQSKELKDGDKIQIGNEVKSLELVFTNKPEPQADAKAPEPPDPTNPERREATHPSPKRQKLDAGEESATDMEEFACSICAELFVNAVTLMCSHSFCHYCIKQWHKSNSDCPICRRRITTITLTRVLDNYILKYGDGQTAEWRRKRADLVKQRQELLANLPSLWITNTTDASSEMEGGDSPENDELTGYEENDHSNIDDEDILDFEGNDNSFEGVFDFVVNENNSSEDEENDDFVDDEPNDHANGDDENHQETDSWSNSLMSSWDLSDDEFLFSDEDWG